MSARDIGEGEEVKEGERRGKTRRKESKKEFGMREDKRSKRVERKGKIMKRSVIVRRGGRGEKGQMFRK